METPDMPPIHDRRDLIKVYGGIGSPYTLKLRAILRYRRIPHIFVLIDDDTGASIEQMRPPIIPVMEFPDGTRDLDTTPLIERLEKQYPEERSIVPSDPVQGFLAWLIEDFADEWATKWMFYYRWAFPEDAELLSNQLAFDRYRSVGADRLRAGAEWFKRRQIDRMPMVGCSSDNASILEETFFRCVAALDHHVRDTSPFLFGGRPSVADFGLFGQLVQLQKDPTPSALMREHGKFAHRWIDWIDDASGFDGDWSDFDTKGSLRDLLALVTDVYLPFLVANAEALAADRDSLEVTLLGKPFRQAPFRYQGKCLNVLRQRFSDLSKPDRAGVEEILQSDRATAVLSA